MLQLADQFVWGNDIKKKKKYRYFQALSCKLGYQESETDLLACLE